MSSEQSAATRVNRQRLSQGKFALILPTHWRTTLRVLAAVALAAGLSAPSSWAQAGSGPSAPSSTGGDPTSNTLSQADGPQKGSNEWQVWLGGAYPIKLFDDAPLARIWTAGATYGRVLTDAHGPGALRGRLEWAFQVEPVVEILLPKRPVYGAGVTPFIWKWDFVTRRRISPYWELYGGALFSNHQVVPGTTTFNFTPGTAAGVSVPWGKSGKYSWTADIRYFHVSNAGLTYYNPGLNTIELRIGFGLFSHRK
jgi:hypothetical protein